MKDVTILIRLSESQGYDVDRNLLKYLLTKAILQADGERLHEVYEVHQILIDKIEDVVAIDKDLNGEFLPF